MLRSRIVGVFNLGEQERDCSPQAALMASTICNENQSKAYNGMGRQAPARRETQASGNGKLQYVDAGSYPPIEEEGKVQEKLLTARNELNQK